MVGLPSLFSRKKRFALTTKRASPHEKKGFTSRAQTPHLDFHPSIGCARAHVFVIFAFLIQALGALKDEPLWVVCDEKNAKFYLERAKDYADKDIYGGG